MVKAVDLIEINRQLGDAITSLSGMKVTLDSVIASLDIPVTGSVPSEISTELPPVQQVQQPSFGPSVAMQGITSQVAQPQELPECFGNYLETDAGCIECDLSGDCSNKTAGVTAQPPVVAPAQSPVVTPVHSQVEAPVQSPVVTPVQSQVEAPAQSPVVTPVQSQIEASTQAPQAVQAAPVHAAGVPSAQADEQLLAGLNEDKRALVRDVANTSNISILEAMEALGLKSG